MAKWFRHESSVPSTHVGQLTIYCNSIFRTSPSSSLWVHISTQTYMYLKIKQTFQKKNPCPVHCPITRIAGRPRNVMPSWTPCVKTITWGHMAPLTGFLLAFPVSGERWGHRCLGPEPKSPLTSPRLKSC